MNEKKLISTLKECVDYLAKKYKLGEPKEQGTCYFASDDSRGHVQMAKVSQDDRFHRFAWHLDLSLFERGKKYKFIGINVNNKYPNDKMEWGVTNDTEDFDYVYGKIKEALK